MLSWLEVVEVGEGVEVVEEVVEVAGNSGEQLMVRLWWPPQHSRAANIYTKH